MKRTFVIIGTVVICLIAVIVMARSLLNARRGVDYTPEGYTKISAKEFQYDDNVTQKDEIIYSTDGFSKVEHTVTLSGDIKMGAVLINNQSKAEVNLKFVSSPNNEYAQDPPLEIKAGATATYTFATPGQYILENTTNSPHRLTVIVQ